MKAIYLVKYNHPLEDSRRVHLILQDAGTVSDLFCNVNRFMEFDSYSLFPWTPYCTNQYEELSVDFFQSLRFKHLFNGFTPTIHKLNTVPGAFFPRIFRPMIIKGASSDILIRQTISPNFINTTNPPLIPHVKDAMFSAIQQLANLKNKLIGTFQAIHPDPLNFKTFSHDLRNLLILACTEVESQFKGILKTNEYGIEKTSTKDYVKLLPALRLSEYSIKFSYYPELGTFCPFANWSEEKPTKSLRWYNEYHNVKHYRTEYFTQANFFNALNSIAALPILLVAQYGDYLPFWKDLIGNFFQLSSVPDFKITDHYLPNFENEGRIILPFFHKAKH